jgi:hypothetical protein
MPYFKRPIDGERDHFYARGSTRIKGISMPPSSLKATYPEAYDLAMQTYNSKLKDAGGVGGEEVEASLEVLSDALAMKRAFSAYSNQSAIAADEMIVELLNQEKADLNKIKSASDLKWTGLHNRCFSIAADGKRTTDKLVPERVEQKLATLAAGEESAVATAT